jgi:PAS domain S-box-containing protein
VKAPGPPRGARGSPPLRLAELRLRLAEAEETIRAIRDGEVDAVVVRGQQGDQVFTLDGAGHAYRLLIESMHEGALTLTVNATILYANRCCAQMLQCPLEQLIGSSFRRFISPNEWATFEPLMQQVDEGGSKIQVRLLPGEGASLPAQISLRPLPKDGLSGATLGVVLTDMTEAHRVALQRETERLYAQALEQAAQLERRVDERTAQLLAANRELEAFESSVSHDLRGPLRHVMGFSELLLDQAAAHPPEMVQQYLHKIRDGAARMERLIEALLKFSRVGRQALVIEEINMVELWHDVLAEIGPAKGGRQVEVTIGALPPCHADPILVRQVVVNLLGNALKYSQTRAVSRVEISAVPAREGEGAVYCVKDNGIGFDMKHAAKLFAVFERLPNAREFEGTGIGLTTVQRIVQMHGGRIWADSAPELGAAFFFTIAPAGSP